jgi:hypothetical protein
VKNVTALAATRIAFSLLPTPFVVARAYPKTRGMVNLCVGALTLPL